jgi:hypothetical protein
MAPLASNGFIFKLHVIVQVIPLLRTEKVCSPHH